jgi:hypothetical protein
MLVVRRGMSGVWDGAFGTDGLVAAGEGMVQTMSNWPIVTVFQGDMGEIGGMPGQRTMMVAQSVKAEPGEYLLVPKDRVRQQQWWWCDTHDWPWMEGDNRCLGTRHIERWRETTDSCIAVTVLIVEINDEQRCTYCGESYPLPVELHHSDSGCEHRRLAHRTRDGAGRGGRR